MKKVILALTLLASFATVSAQETKKADSNKVKEASKKAENSAIQSQAMPSKAIEATDETVKKNNAALEEKRRKANEEAQKKTPQ